MEVTHTLRLPVTEVSEAGEARRRVTALAESLGFDETDAGRVALVVTEAAGNLVKHARQGGELLVRALSDGATGIEVLALDCGPGMPSIAQAMVDGYSTAGSPGTGLGAMSRLAQRFEAHSVAEVGTVLLARIWPEAARLPTLPLEIGVVNVPKAGEEVCGDAWAAVHQPGRSRVLVVDGLGHGQGAAEASAEAVRTFLAQPTIPPAELIDVLHGALRPTRGAAVAVAEVDVEERVVRFAGVGNIAGMIYSGGEMSSLVSHNGTVGHQLLRVQEFTYPWPEDALLVLASDGISTRWSLDRYPGLTVRDPAVIAGVLYRDFTRGRDDATVLVARDARPAGAAV